MGYFAFAQDEAQRKKQRDTLDMLRDQVSGSLGAYVTRACVLI